MFLAGQTAHDADGQIRGNTVPEQFEHAAENVVAALDAAGARPEHLVSLQIFVTSMDEYRSARRELAHVWRRHFGRWYPAMALFEVSALFDPEARVELVGFAVVPDA